MGIPLGDILRALPIPGWLRKVLNVTKGSSVTIRGTEIQLDERPGIGGSSAPPDLRRPHMPGRIGR